jgi:hypothetical protein
MLVFRPASISPMDAALRGIAARLATGAPGIMPAPAIATVRSNASRRLSPIVIRLHPAQGRNFAILASQAAPDKRDCAELHGQMADFARLWNRRPRPPARLCIVYMTTII